MPRIAGTDIPNGKKAHIALRYLYGVGPKNSLDILKAADVDPDKKSQDLTEDEIATIAGILESDYTVEGALRRQINQNIGRLRDIGSYRGIRHRKGLPVRGQRTGKNARTRKGPRKTVAGKKGAK